MILEVAILDIHEGQESAFQTAFAQAYPIIATAPGNLGTELQRCIEKPNRFILLAKWATLEDHTVGFRGSLAYQEWKTLLHRFYNPFPIVEHFEVLILALQV